MPLLDQMPDVDPGMKLVLVAATGGHLAQLVRIAPLLAPADDSLWITFDSPQGRSLLEGRRLIFVPYVGARDPLNALRAYRAARRATAQERFDAGVSTGSGVSLGVFAALRSRGVPTHYIESVSRTHGPSLTGRLQARSHIASHVYTQHPAWRYGRWKPVPAVMASYKHQPGSREITAGRPLRLFVTLGTFRGYRFDRLLDRLLAIGALNDESVIQTGDTERTDLPGTVVRELPAADYERCCREADVVVTHAGVGSILQMLDLGLCPVVVPRRAGRREHVDDHQLQICELLEQRGLAVVRDADALEVGDLELAAATATETA